MSHLLLIDDVPVLIPEHVRLARLAPSGPVRLGGLPADPQSRCANPGNLRHVGQDGGYGHLDRLLLLRVLEFTGGNQHQATRLLGIARQTLRIKRRDLGLSVAQSVDAEEG